MKWVYIFGGLTAIALVLSPLVLLPAESPTQYDDLIVGWNLDNTPITKAKPIISYDTYATAMASRDPATCGDTTSAHFQGHFYEGLYNYHYLKRPVELEPILAASMPTISEDKLTYTIKIKKNIFYSRNICFGKLNTAQKYKTRAVTADDFVLAFKRASDYHIDTSLSWSFIAGKIEGTIEYNKITETKYDPLDFSRYKKENISGIKALDDHTLQIKLVKPFPQFIYVLAMNSYAPIPHEAVDYWMPRQELTTFIDWRSVVGTGPYIIKSYKLKNTMVLARNPDYRECYYPSSGEARKVAKDGTVIYEGDKEMGLLDDAGKRIPFIDIKVYKWLEQPFPNWKLFLNKRRDIAAIPSEAFEAVITPGKDLTDEWKKKGIYLRKSWSPSVYWLGFNMQDKVIGASPSLRRAMALAFDVESYVKIMYNGRGKRATNVIPSMLPEHDLAGTGKYYRPVPKDLAGDELKKYWVKRNAEAKALLVKAKDELKIAGLLTSNGDLPKLKLNMTQYPKASQIATFIAQQFEKIGLDFESEFSDWPTLQQKVHSGKVQMYIMGWHADYPDAENFLQLFYSPNIGKTNSTCYKNAEYDKLYDLSSDMEPGLERSKIFAKMTQIINNDCPAVLLTEPLSFVMAYDWVKNLKPHPIGYGYFKYRKIDTELRKKSGGRN